MDPQNTPLALIPNLIPALTWWEETLCSPHQAPSCPYPSAKPTSPMLRSWGSRKTPTYHPASRFPAIFDRSSIVNSSLRRTESMVLLNLFRQIQPNPNHNSGH